VDEDVPEPVDDCEDESEPSVAQSPITPPTVDVSLTDLPSTGTITGNIGASDPDGDGLTYTVTQGPSFGRLVINQATGDYTYTPVVDLGLVGGSDTFTVQVSDDTNLHLHGPLGLLTAPFDIFERIPFIGSLTTSTLKPLGFWPSSPDTATTVVNIAIQGTDPNATLTFPAGFHWGWPARDSSTKEEIPPYRAWSSIRTPTGTSGPTTRSTRSLVS